MENWEFLLQRKGDKSWLPLESPTVEILEGQYRLAARSDAANELVGIAIGYQPLAEVRHQPLQQKLAKRVSQDGLLIVMPYTNFAPGLWQVDCFAALLDKEEDTEKLATRWKKTVKFDVIQISADAGSDWQYSDIEESDLEISTEITNDIPSNALGIEQTEPAPLVYSSPILEIEEQRSTELVQSMFDEFALFDDEIDESAEVEDAVTRERESNLDNLASSEMPEADTTDTQTNAPLQPRVLLRLQQPQYIIEADNCFHLIGDAYTKGQIEVNLKNPQTLEVVVNSRHEIANLGDRNASTGAIPFKYKIQVPPPSEIQVLIGDVQIHPHQDFQQYGDLFIAQQAIAVSYPASRLLPQLIKEAQQAQQESAVGDSSHYGVTSAGGIRPNVMAEPDSLRKSSYPQNSQSFPQAERPTATPSTKAKPVNALSLPPLPSNKPKVTDHQPLEPQRLDVALSLPPLPSPHSKSSNLSATEFDADSFPQTEINDLSSFDADPAFADWAGELADSPELGNMDSQNLVTEDEPELTYSFEEELPQNYEELLEQPLREINKNPSSSLPTFNSSSAIPRNRNNRFLNKLQTLSAEAIAAQKANQRTEELFLDQVPSSEPLIAAEALANLPTELSIDLDQPDQSPRTIAEANSLADLDVELDAELDRLLMPEPDLMLNEYVWEETVDPNTFPVRTVNNSAAETLSETAQTIRNLQGTATESLSEQEAIPIPEIIVPNGEIISGTPMAITVRLPAMAPKFFVKFWIKDLQTRMIVDGPRWLLDFVAIPDAGYIETRTNISIPLSSIDVAFEAIAIEAQTQRESHKVRVTRAVAPPNLAQDNNFDY